VLNAPDDMLPDHPVADRGPYLSPGPRTKFEGLVGLVVLMGVFSDNEGGGIMETSGDGSGESYMNEAGSMFTIGVSAGIDVDGSRGLLGAFGSCKSMGRAGAFPFQLEMRLIGVTGSCSDWRGTRSDNSPANIPLSELPHPFEVLSSSFNRGGMGLFCANARLTSTSLTLMLRRLVCFEEEATSLNSFPTGVVVGDSSLPGMATTTIELLSDS